MILVTIWTGGMGDAPLVIKLFGSFIALGTIIKAFGFILSGSDFMPNLRRLSDRVRFMAKSFGQVHKPGDPKTDAPPQVSYSCPDCGSDIGERADVSPGGDVRCRVQQALVQQ